MATPGRYDVTPLDEGTLFVTKQMEADSGRVLPGHIASTESVIVVIDGACVLKLGDTEHVLRQGHSFIIPGDVWHQITAHPEFAAIHIMPREIQFRFTG